MEFLCENEKNPDVFCGGSNDVLQNSLFENNNVFDIYSLLDEQN